ncbi:nitroreductase family protein [uncultured Methanoregula sp.]|uniref:nitroreductase family protein n=1 Tax=uncultured Methanoregula sp. TaxID=1005933 RepID=UPI002AAC18B6|nr:nitroreductase family protein [uncultured Methanoregula sp.]
MNVVTTIIRSRHSVRKFKTDSIDDKVIQDALECALCAPTAMNHQPYLFVIVKQKDTLSKIAGFADHGRFIEDSQACVAVFGEKQETYYLEDCCAATENLILALQAYGVCSCWVAGDKKSYAEPVRELLKVPLKYTLVSLVAAGYPAEVPVVKKKLMKTLVYFEKYEEKLL